MKNLKKKLSLLSLMLTSLLFLAGCVKAELDSSGMRVPTEAAKEGWVYKLLVVPMSSFVDFFAESPGLALGYGWGIILVTLIIRLCLLPLALNQQYKATYMQEKTAYLKPIFEPINKRMQEARERKDQNTMAEAQQELMKAQKENGINMFASLGCIPTLLQYPFFIALYNAAAYTPGISTAKFYGIDLGHPSIILTIIAGVFYAIQTLIMAQGIPEEQRKQQKTMLILSPAMIVMFSFMSPAGVTLYWVAGGLIIVIQQVIVTYVIKPRMRKRIDKEFEENPPKISETVKDVTPVASYQKKKKSNPKQNKRNSNSKGRNAGKQNR
ncbi:MAG: membrane protein insertase YidC [Lactovum sp.]